MFQYYGLLLCCHLVGDYYLQVDSLAKRKQEQLRGVLMHSFLYVIAFLPLVALLHLSLGKGVFVVFSLGFSHFLVDAFSRRYCSFTSLMIDQVLHMGALMAIAVLFPLPVQ
ncbi:MAG: DUF3307 domain-containing protein, partial [Spirochaetia bacterium]|nr:DUF3307 domain-containing protein [Spirochaetia bacterium]